MLSLSVCGTAHQVFCRSCLSISPSRLRLRPKRNRRRTGRGKRHGLARIMLVILINNIVFRYKSISIHPNSVKPPLHRETTAFYSYSGLSPVRENTLCVRRACTREQLVSQFPAFVVGVLCKVCLCCQHCGCRHGQIGHAEAAQHRRMPAVPAISPHTPTSIPFSFAALAVMAIRRSTPGCSGRYR